jgi:hypothetical protein
MNLPAEDAEALKVAGKLPTLPTAFATLNEFDVEVPGPEPLARKRTNLTADRVRMEDRLLLMLPTETRPLMLTVTSPLSPKARAKLTTSGPSLPLPFTLVPNEAFGSEGLVTLALAGICLVFGLPLVAKRLALPEYLPFDGPAKLEVVAMGPPKIKAPTRTVLAMVKKGMEKC